jgi:membrane peptidoglycan carboxypeptidase
VIADPRCETNGVPWTVINAEGTSLGSMDLYRATAESVNAVFARLILDVGPEHVVEVARQMGVETPLPSVCSLATGSVAISPLDQAAGYQTLANGGVHCEPFAVETISRRDQLLFRHHDDCTRVMKAPVANLVTDLLEGPVTYGTASSVFSSGWGDWPLRGKTGTADLNKAVWFVGYTRQVSTAVWVGSQGDPYPLYDRYGQPLFGSSIAAPIWKEYMLRVMAGMPAEDFPKPVLVHVPNVVGLPEDQAIAVLKAAHLKVTTHMVGSFRPAGTVAEQSPGGGAATIAGATVSLGISNGIPPVNVVPKVKGMTVEEATATLAAANFLVEVVETPTPDKELEGIVLRQSPSFGTQLEEGSTVTIFVGAKKHGGGPPSPSPSPGPDGLRFSPGAL